MLRKIFGSVASVSLRYDYVNYVPHLTEFQNINLEQQFHIYFQVLLTVNIGMSFKRCLKGPHVWIMVKHFDGISILCLNNGWYNLLKV